MSHGMANPSLPAGDNNIGNVDVVTLPALPAGNNNIGDVDVVTLPALVAGTANIGRVEGQQDHDSNTLSRPIMAGLRAKAHGSAPSAVADADVTHWYANRDGVPFVIGGHPNIERLTAKYTSAQTDTVLKSIAGGAKFVVTQVSAFIDNACSVDVGVLFEFDDSSDVRISEHPGLAPGSGYTEGSGAGMLAVGGDGQDVLVTVEVPTGGSVVVSVSGYSIPS